MGNENIDFDDIGKEELVKSSTSQSLTIRDAVVMYLKNQFGEAFSKENSESDIVIKVDNSYAEININTMVIIIKPSYIHFGFIFANLFYILTGNKNRK